MNPRMKTLALALLLFLALCTTSCTDSQASSDHEATASPENGAQFTEGKGVILTESMAKSIALKTAEVTDEKMTPVIMLNLQTATKGNQAIGWVTPEQAANLRVGTRAELKVAADKSKTFEGKVVRIEPSIIANGDLEIIVEIPTALDAGTAINAVIRLEQGAERTAIPKSALLATAEGNFVYAKNAEFYLRTPVKTGAVSDQHVEIVDGLYSGDEIVTSPVMSLWLAELQVLRGGKACTCGH